MSKNMTGKWALLVIAFIVSCLIWYMVITNDDPRINISLGNIEVELLNGEQLHDEGMAYYVEENASVEVVVNVIQERGWLVKASDIRLTADLSELNGTEAMLPIKAEVVNNQGIIGGNYKLDETSIKVRTEELVEKEIPITIGIEGVPEDNCSIGTPVPEKESVTIRVPKSLENQVVSAGAAVDISGRSADYEGDVTLSFFDENESAVDCSEQQIFPEIDTVSVKIPIGLTKEVKIGTLLGSGICAEGYRCTDITSNKKSVTVLGSEDTLASLELINIPASKIVLTGQDESFELKIDLTEYLPEGVIVYDPQDEVIKVSVTVQALKKKTFALPSAGIELKNVPSSLIPKVNTAHIQVVIEALPEELDALAPDKIHMSVDLKNYKAGSHKIDIDFKIDADDGMKYEIISSDKVSVTLEKS